MTNSVGTNNLQGDVAGYPEREVREICQNASPERPNRPNQPIDAPRTVVPVLGPKKTLRIMQARIRDEAFYQGLGVNGCVA